MNTDLPSLIAIALLLLFSAFFSSSETGLFSLDILTFRKLRRKKGYKRISAMLSRSSVLLITILLGNTAVNVALSSLLERQLSINNYLLATVTVTAIILFFGEIIPKTVAVSHAEGVSLFNSRLLYPLFYVFRPIVAPIEALSNVILLWMNRFFQREKDDNDAHLDALLSIVSRGSFLNSDEKKLVESVLKFSGREVWNIMVPRNKLVSVEKDASVKELVGLIKKFRYSKIPVFSEQDNQIVGVIYLRNIFEYIHSPEKAADKKVSDIMEDMYFIPKTKRLSEMLEDFQQKKIRVATVVDEYGSAIGIVTLADVLGEIVGEIVDEKLNIKKKIIRLSKTRSLVSGDISIDDFNENFDTHLSSEEFETLAGYIIEQVEDIPEVGYTLDLSKVSIRVRERRSNHIEKFLVERK